MKITTTVVVVCGHYGVGKTNFSLNLAHDAAAAGVCVTLIDLDIVNPYFRSSDYVSELKNSGIEVIAPVFAHKTTSLDTPSLTGAIIPAIEKAYEQASAEARGEEHCTKGSTTIEFPSHLLIIDAGGDDAGATALARFAPYIKRGTYEMLYVVNQRRNLTQTTAEALEILTEIEHASALRCSAIVNNTHLQKETSAQIIDEGIPFAQELARTANVPLLCTTIPESVASVLQKRKTCVIDRLVSKQMLYPVQIYVHTPWSG